MRFSATKEVGWEADDECENPKPSRKVNKRYRFVLDFGRSSKEFKHRSDRAATRAERQKDHVLPEKRADGTERQWHSCFVCGKTRSSLYHHQHQDTAKVGGKAMIIPSLCRGCRRDRNTRIADRARDGNRRRRVTRMQAHVDNRQWCANCGVLRSEHYHRVYASGNLPPWAEICGKCKNSAEKHGNRQLYQLYVENQEAKNRGDRKQQHELARDVIPRHQTGRATRQPKPDFAHVKDERVSHSSSASSLPADTGRLNDSSYSERQASVRSVIREESQDNLISIKKGLKSSSVRSSVLKATVEDDASEDNNNPAEVKCQEFRKPSQSQQHNHDGSLVTTPTDFDTRRENRHQDHVNREQKSKATTQPEQQDHHYDENKSKPEHNQAQSPPPKRMGISDMYWAAEKDKLEHNQPQPQSRSPPKPKRMGISDMYWASENGKLEQVLSPTFLFCDSSHPTASGGGGGLSGSGFDCAYFDFDFGYGYTSAYYHDAQEHDEEQQEEEEGDEEEEHERGHGSMNRSGSLHDMSDDEDIVNKQIWEVDSDEADEIDKAHASLVTGRVRC